MKGKQNTVRPLTPLSPTQVGWQERAGNVLFSLSLCKRKGLDSGSQCPVLLCSGPCDVPPTQLCSGPCDVPPTQPCNGGLVPATGMPTDRFPFGDCVHGRVALPSRKSLHPMTDQCRRESPGHGGPIWAAMGLAEAAAGPASQLTFFLSPAQPISSTDVEPKGTS